ncbi:hypothetical protein, partial [Planococcus koreensis]|uniref:hypothetical protein n=1 Tax=Planococcus koreensis TaxID=112331 RepID=UPI0019D655CF
RISSVAERISSITERIFNAMGRIPAAPEQNRKPHNVKTKTRSRHENAESGFAVKLFFFR